jgi:hypothetical protein
VAEASAEPGARRALLTVYPEEADALREGAGLRAYTVPTTAAWVARTLVPPERLAEIRDRVARFWETEGVALRVAVWPHLRQGLLDTLSLYEQELPKALARHADRWEALLVRHRDGVVREELVPALREVTFVLAEKRFGPLLDTVGKELWEALPVWGLGWRAVWEKVPFTSEGQVRDRFAQYLEDDAKPILAAHAGEAAEIAGEVLRESLEDPRVRGALGAVFREFFTDPELGALLKQLFRDLVVENEEFHTLWRRRWESGLSAAMSDAAARLEPLISRVVDSVVLTRDRSSLNPRLTRVLRTRVLRKDCRWVLLTPGAGAPLPDGATITGDRGEE